MFPQVVQTLVRRGGITKSHSIAYSLSNISAKNYQNRLMCVEVIVCSINVVFRHNVQEVSSVLNFTYLQIYPDVRCHL